MDLLIRPAQLDEALFLAELAMRSKAHWGYDHDFLERWRPELFSDFSEQAMAKRISNVLEIAGTVVGYYRLLPKSQSVILLDDLWLEPAQIGKGLGRILFEHACRVAAGKGYPMLTLIAEPYAQGFYDKMGAVVVGQEESSVLPGRMLPVMNLNLEQIKQ